MGRRKTGPLTVIDGDRQLADDFESWLAEGWEIRDKAESAMWELGDWWNRGEPYGDRVKAAKEEGRLPYEYGTCRTAGWVTEAIDVSIRIDTLPWHVHRQVAALPNLREKKRALKWAEQNNATVRDMRKYVRREKAKLTYGEPDVPEELEALEGDYRVIYADPPWSYDNEMAEYATTPEDHYGQMTTGEIIAMPVRDIALKDSVLFLWATCPLLLEALDVMSAWGFSYKAQFVWDKVRHNMGHYNSVRHELLLIGVRGSCTPDVQELFDSVQTIEAGKHSEKPAKFREIIDTLYPYGNRIELFARETGENWYAWGNQISGRA